MRVEIFKGMPSCASKIREEVFIKEQGFENEYDEIDNTATHIVLFDEDAVSTCRVFESEERNVYILGRLAVVKKQRGKGVGSETVAEALNYVKGVGGKKLILHSQLHATDFYKKLGFAEFGEIEYEQGCPHIWMEKEV